jgi:hypothetical protein
MNRMNDTKSTLGLAFQNKTSGSGGAPPSAAAGVPSQRWSRQQGRQSSPVRPPSIARFPGLHCPQSSIVNGGISL